MSPLNHAERITLIEPLEQYPDLVPCCYKALETAIANLMDETFWSTDPKEEVRLASLEMRARIVLRRWRKSGVN